MTPYEKKVWLLGSGRSGTTWLSNLINHNHSYRELFEPFHPLKEKFLKRNQYITASNVTPEFLNLAVSVFSGKHLTMRIDKENKNFFYKNLLIKDIFANLFAHYVSKLFPELKIILLLRNPFAVALSRYRTKDWYWMTEPAEFLEQKELKQDFLLPFEDLIGQVSRKNDYIEKQILIWAITNYVPLCQFSRDIIHVTFYENIFLDPQQEIVELNKFIYPDQKNIAVEINKEVIEKPSRVATTKNFSITSWKDEISASQIDEGMHILSHFGMEKLYDENSIPDIEVLNNFHKIYK